MKKSPQQKGQENLAEGKEAASATSVKASEEPENVSPNSGETSPKNLDDIEDTDEGEAEDSDTESPETWFRTNSARLKQLGVPHPVLRAISKIAIPRPVGRRTSRFSHAKTKTPKYPARTVEKISQVRTTPT